MTDIAVSHRRALEATRGVVSGITADQLDAPTPDAAWDVRALLNHLVSGNLWAAELGAGRTIDDVGDVFDGDVVRDDPLGAYDRSAELAAAVFEAPGALDAPCAVSYGPVPGSVYAGHRFVDVLIHGWDLAMATSQDSRLDPDLVQDCVDVLAPQLAMLQASGVFGVAIAVDPTADAQTRLLASLGREA
jgi:uncharacterized protein (TIGR03086 family)